MNIEIFSNFLATNWAWALALAGGFGVMTRISYGLLPMGKKDSLALWLMGAESDQSWSRSICDLFDAIFGANHLSLKCIVRSSLASLAAVVAIWVFLGSTGTLNIRADATLGLGQVLLIGLFINLLADYLSLL
jgi:hypothetical protein